MRSLRVALALSVLSLAPSSLAQAARFQVNVEQSVAHALQPIGFSVDLSGSAMTATAFPEANVMARVSGPPGGPQLIEVRTFGGLADEATLLRQINGAYASRQGFSLGVASTVSLAGAPRSARSFRTGVSQAATSWCAIALQSPRQRRPFGMWVAVGLGGALSCEQIVASPQLRRAIESFAIVQ